MFSLSINTAVVAEAANKVTVKIKGLDICKAIAVFIIFGAALKLLLITALFPKLKMWVTKHFYNHSYYL